MLVARLLVARMVNASTPETYMESLCQMMPNVFDSQLWNWGLLAQSQRIKGSKGASLTFLILLGLFHGQMDKGTIARSPAAATSSNS